MDRKMLQIYKDAGYEDEEGQWVDFDVEQDATTESAGIILDIAEFRTHNNRENDKFHEITDKMLDVNYDAEKDVEDMVDNWGKTDNGWFWKKLLINIKMEKLVNKLLETIKEVRELKGFIAKDQFRWEMENKMNEMRMVFKKTEAEWHLLNSIEESWEE